jgi:hypothetical protein
MPAETDDAKTPSQLIDGRIRELADWRGIICTGETYKSVVKLTFAKGASLDDPSSLFNSSLEGNVRRAIDIRENEEIDAKALTTLIHAAIALNKLKPPRR